MIMNTFRDSPVGQLIRLLSGWRLLRYPEEIQPSSWVSFIEKREETEVKVEDPTLESAEGYGLYTLTSQVVQAHRTRSAESNDLKNGIAKDPEFGKDCNIVGWRSSDDPEHPQNWSVSKKLFVSTQICLLTFAVYIGSAIYSPSIPGVSETFGVSSVAATLGLTLFVAGYGVGPLLWSPLSEIPYIGRSPIYIGTLIVFVFFQFAVIYAKNFGMLLAFRFLTGFFGSPALATGGASLGDMWNARVRNYAISMWGTFAICAPVLGPLIGGFAVTRNGWTWSIWELMWISGFALVFLGVALPETSAPNILCRRALRLRRVTGNQNLKSLSEIEMEGIAVKEIAFEALVRPFQLCFLEPVVLVMNIYCALIYGILYLFFEAWPIVFGEIHGFNAGETGLAFLGILVGTVFTTMGYFSWKYWVQSKYYDDNGDIAPEYQLPPACLGAFCLPVALLWFGWTGNFASVHWIVPIISTLFYSVGGCLVFNCIFCYQVDAYPKYAASVLAGNDFIRSSFGAAFPLFGAAMFHNLGVGWACTLLGCLTALFVPYPFVLYKKGRQLRMASKYARHDI